MTVKRQDSGKWSSGLEKQKMIMQRVNTKTVFKKKKKGMIRLVAVKDCLQNKERNPSIHPFMSYLRDSKERLSRKAISCGWKY